MKRLEGKVCIITGANSGFGKEMTRLFASEGAKIVAADYNPDIMNINKLIEGDITPCLCDVSKFDEVQAMVKLCEDTYGNLMFYATTQAKTIKKHTDCTNTLLMNGTIYMEF